MASLSDTKYHDVLLWNESTTDWLSVTMWFGIFSSLGARMYTSGLVRSLFVTQTTWFVKADF